MGPGVPYVGEQGHLRLPTSLENKTPTALLQCLPCQAASSTPHHQQPHQTLCRAPQESWRLTPLLHQFPALSLVPGAAGPPSSCALPREGERKPAQQETQGWSRGYGDEPTAGWDLLLPWSCQRAAVTALWSRAALHWYAGRKGARLGWQRASGQDGAVLAEPAGRGSC